MPEIKFKLCCFFCLCCMVSISLITSLEQEIHEGLDCSRNGDDDDEFGIFSVKFSTDGKELVAAGSDNYIYVYNLSENRCTLRVPAHEV